MLTVEITILISIISVTAAVFFGVKSSKRTESQDIKEETTQTTMLMTKLEMISNDLKEIKADNKNTREDVQNLRERVAVTENSLKSLHKRLDEKVVIREDN